MSIMS